MVPPLMFSRSEYPSPYAVVLVSLSWKACVALTDSEVVQRSIAVLLPPLCQKSGTPSLLASVSRVGFGQKLPGSRPAGSCCSQARLKTTVNRTAALRAIWLKHASLLISLRRVCSRQQIDSNLIANILIVSCTPTSLQWAKAAQCSELAMLRDRIQNGRGHVFFCPARLVLAGKRCARVSLLLNDAIEAGASLGSAVQERRREAA